jgi:hypothetical protein
MNGRVFLPGVAADEAEASSISKNFTTPVIIFILYFDSQLAVSSNSAQHDLSRTHAPH